MINRAGTDFAGRSILITGSAGIAGASPPCAASAKSASVFVGWRTPDDGRALAEGVTGAGGEAGSAAGPT